MARQHGRKPSLSRRTSSDGKLNLPDAMGSIENSNRLAAEIELDGSNRRVVDDDPYRSSEGWKLITVPFGKFLPNTIECLPQESYGPRVRSKSIRTSRSTPMKKATNNG